MTSVHGDLLSVEGDSTLRRAKVVRSLFRPWRIGKSVGEVQYSTLS